MASNPGLGDCVRFLAGELMSKTNTAHPVSAFENGLPPRPLVHIPVNSFLDPAFEMLLSAPAQFTFKLCGVDGIAPVVPRSILDKGYQISSRAILAGRDIIEQIANAFYHVEVRPFIAAPHVIGLPDVAVFEHERQRLRVILDKKPVSNV